MNISYEYWIYMFNSFILIRLPFFCKRKLTKIYQKIILYQLCFVLEYNFTEIIFFEKVVNSRLDRHK